MRIFYINVIEQNAGWGAECFVNRGFLTNGNQTVTLDYRKYRFHLAVQLEDMDDFDVLLLQRGEGFPIELLKAVNRPRFFWASELVSRCRDQDRLLKSGLFEHVFVHSKACEREVIERGWLKPGKVSTLINGFDESLHRKISEVKKDIDVVFVGTILPRRRAILDKLKTKFQIVESQAYGEKLVQLFNQAKIVLNIHAEDHLDTETRIFEALGCGAFVLSERLSEENPFQSGVHLVEVDGLGELEQKLDYYLRNEDERNRIAEQGYQEALQKHTYTVRAKEITDIMAKYLPSTPWAESPINKKLVHSYGKIEQLSSILNCTKDFLRRIKTGRA